MDYPCSVILDLLPLYYDGVCSEETAKIVRQHLEQCEACKTKFHSLCEEENFLPTGGNERCEEQKMASLKKMKHLLHIRQMQITCTAIFIFCIVVVGLYVWMDRTMVLVEDPQRISVYYSENGDLIARLSGGEYRTASCKLVTTEEDNQAKGTLYVSFTESLWDKLTHQEKNVYSEFCLSYADKGADNIDEVYYDTGEKAGLEELGREELSEREKTATLIWSKK